MFGGPPRQPESELGQREMDLAASVQVVTEMAMDKIARFVREKTGMKNLCLAGGVALNCVANGKLLRSKVFDDIWIQPAAGDAGGALGVALSVWHTYLQQPRPLREDGKDLQFGSYLGPAPDTDASPRPTSTKSAPSTPNTAPKTCPRRWPRSSPTRRSSGSAKAGWSSGLAPSAVARSWATPARLTCRRR